jgi:hypothetical protein
VPALSPGAAPRDRDGPWSTGPTWTASDDRSPLGWCGERDVSIPCANGLRVSGVGSVCVWHELYA